jgi:hypothetical protein
MYIAFLYGARGLFLSWLISASFLLAYLICFYFFHVTLHMCTQVGGIDVRTFADVQAALISVRTLAEQIEAALKSGSSAGDASSSTVAARAAGTPGSRYYVLQLANAVRDMKYAQLNFGSDLFFFLLRISISLP